MVDDTKSVASLGDKLDFLSRASSYDETTAAVDVQETHMAWVFLTERYVYKLKKPVRYPYLDFTTLAARYADSQAELTLNRRLAPDVYLGVVALTQDAAGDLHIGGEGTVVDWLVKMHRLPADGMLDVAIARKRVALERLRPAALHLAAFYVAAAPEPMTAESYRRRIAGEIAANAGDLARPAYGLPTDQVDRITMRQSAFLRLHAGMFDRRVAAHRIIEAHGDLRPEHVFLGPPPAVIDCLEFRRDYRILDPVEELCFLSMECEQLEAPRVGEAFLAIYRQAADDDVPTGLIDFYKSHRACLRARITIWHLDDATVREPEKWPPLARRYLDLADRYAALLV